MRIVAIVQARMGSSRLPGKVMLDLAGRTALDRCLDRVERIDGLSDVAVATSNRDADDVIAKAMSRRGVTVVRGSEADVVSRYAEAASRTNANVIIRITSDCPLLDPVISSVVLRTFLDLPTSLRARAYVSNTLERRMPRGLDTEVFSLDALNEAHRFAVGAEREHVTMHMYRNPERFHCASATPEGMRDLSHHRWTLDTLDDYRFLFEICMALDGRVRHASMGDIIALVESRPELARINAHISQKAS